MFPIPENNAKIRTVVFRTFQKLYSFPSTLTILNLPSQHALRPFTTVLVHFFNQRVKAQAPYFSKKNREWSLLTSLHHSNTSAPLIPTKNTYNDLSSIQQTFLLSCHQPAVPPVRSTFFSHISNKDVLYKYKFRAGWSDQLPCEKVSFPEYLFVYFRKIIKENMTYFHDIPWHTLFQFIDMHAQLWHCTFTSDYLK